MSKVKMIWLVAISASVVPDIALITAVFAPDLMEIFNVGRNGWSTYIPLTLAFIWVAIILACLAEKKVINHLLLAICMPHCLFFWYLCLAGGRGFSEVGFYLVWLTITWTAASLALGIEAVLVNALGRK